MTRKEFIDAICGYVAPLDPLGDVVERERSEEAWIAAGGAALLDEALAVAAQPPTADELGRVTPEDFDYELARVLSLAGTRDPAAFFARVGAHLDDARARPMLIEAIGAIGAPEGVAWLEPLVRRGDATDDEAVRLACALGDIGGPEAEVLLKVLAARTPVGRVRVEEEIAIAREAIARRSVAPPKR